MRRGKYLEYVMDDNRSDVEHVKEVVKKAATTMKIIEQIGEREKTDDVWLPDKKHDDVWSGSQTMGETSEIKSSL